MTKLLLSRKEAAALLGISVASVESLTASKQLTSIKVGRAVKIHVDVLSEFARTGTQNKTVTGKELDPLWRGKQ